MDITVKGFGNPHTKFGVLLSMHVWFIAWGGGQFFLLMLVMYLLSRHSTYHATMWVLKLPGKSGGGKLW